MGQNYIEIRNQYLRKAWSRPPDDLEASLPAHRAEGCLQFEAFGETCVLSEQEVHLSGLATTGPEGLLIAMYACFARDLPAQLAPLKSFKELPGSMPYHCAFHAHAERALVPHVESLQPRQAVIATRFSGHLNRDAASGDFSFTLRPLPRVPLYYIFHLPDEEFPASVTCLFGANAMDFMPLDGLADVAECTTKRIIGLLGGR
jgi:hypothetical protein